jgi:hypothetical protein
MTKSLNKALARCLMDLLFQLETADASQIDDDFALALMEMVGASLKILDNLDLVELVEFINDEAEVEMDTKRRKYLDEFRENFGLPDI